MEQNVIFALVLGWLAMLKISDWALKYATFDGNLFMFSWAFFKNHVFSVRTRQLHKMVIKKTIHFCLKI